MNNNVIGQAMLITYAELGVQIDKFDNTDAGIVLLFSVPKNSYHKGANNIEIKFSGLREGEKLYEEVLNDAEHTKPTVHPKIKVAAVREYPYELALKNEIELYALSTTFDDMAIVRKMKEIVPEYKSKHSKYEELDN